jgi:transposase
MPYLCGVPRDQVMLLPETVEDYVGADNPVRVIEAFVEGLSLAQLGLKLKGQGGAGAPAYDPRALLKLYVYGYLNRIRSSRELEKAAGRNLELIWLLRQLQPDHWTINAFRRENRGCFKALFRQFNLLCAKLELFGKELVAIDGSILKAVNSPARNFSRAKLEGWLQQIDERTEAYLGKLEQSDGDSDGQGLGHGPSAEEKVQSLRKKLEQLAETRREYAAMLEQIAGIPGAQISLSDPESRSLCKGHEHTEGYNVQIAVDGAHHLIVAEEVTTQPNDSQMLAPMVEAVQAALGVEQIEVVADRGYYNIEQLERCARLGVDPIVPAQRAANPPGDGTYPLERFAYMSERDCFVCPEGKELWRHQDTSKSSGQYRTYYHVAACKDCPVRAQCTKGRYRKLTVHQHAKVVAAVRERLAQKPDAMAQRKALVEHPFGTLKFWYGYRAFLTRGLEMVRAEFSLSCLAYNLRRALNAVGVAELVKAIQAPSTT